MSNEKEFLLNTVLSMAEHWPKDHLDGYIKKLEEQVNNIRDLLRGLKQIQTRKQKEINRKLRDSGTRGAT